MNKEVLTAKEIKKWLLENCVDNDGDLVLGDLDFSDFDGNVYILCWKVKGNLNQSHHKVGGNLFQSYHKVGGNLEQHHHKVGGYLEQYRHEVDGDLYQAHNNIKGNLNQSHHKVGGNLFQSYHKVGGNLEQYRHEVDGDLYQAHNNIKGNLYQHHKSVVFDEFYVESNKQKGRKKMKYTLSIIKNNSIQHITYDNKDDALFAYWYKSNKTNVEVLQLWQHADNKTIDTDLFATLLKQN